MLADNQEYRTKLQETLKYYAHVQKIDNELSELLNELNIANESRVSKQDAVAKNLEQIRTTLDTKSQPLQDKRQHYNFIHKNQLDEFMAICESLLQQDLSSEDCIQMHADLIQAGFKLEKDGVNHPLLQKLDHDLKNRK